MFRKNNPFRTNYSSIFFFESSESDRVFNYLHDSNSIFRVGRINSEWVFGRTVQQDESEHYKRFLHRSARLYQQSMQQCIAEELNLHERALQAVKSVCPPRKDEPETKEIITDVLCGLLLLENAALTGSEQVFVFGVAGKSYAYNHIANALRETWGNDDRLQEP